MIGEQGANNSLHIFMKRVTSSIKNISKEELFKIIDANTEIVVMAPWNGVAIPVTIRMLSSIEFAYCGDFNTAAHLMTTDKEQEDVNIKDIVETKNIQESLIKLALVHPTYDEIEAHLVAKDFVKSAKVKIEETKELIAQLDKEEEKQQFVKELELLELSIAFLFPEDFMTYIITILLQKEATDLNKLTREMLIKAGFLGEKYNVRPSQYIGGTFTEKQNIDIDAAALMLVYQYREDQKLDTQSNMKWIRGRSKK